MKVVWMVLIAAIIAAGLSGGGVYYFVSQHYVKDKAEMQSKIDDLNSQAAKYKAAIAENTENPSASTTTATTATPAVNDVGQDAASAALSNYLSTKKTRGLTNAKPYMSEAFYKTYTQETFAGVSSPSMSRFEIVSATAKTINSSYEISAKLYYSLQGQEVGYYPNSYEVMKVGSKYLVNSEVQGKWVESN